MSMHAAALGGARRIPAPDPIARDYLLLALRLDQRVSGLVDAYFGPADLKAAVDLEQLPSPVRLRDDAAALRARLAAEVDDPARRRWLAAQLTALERHASVLAGEALPYVEHVARCFDLRPERRDESEFVAAAADLERLLPGSGSLTARLAAADEQVTIAPERLPAVVGWLVERFRTRAAELFGLPPGEALSVAFVHERPWSGYNWYDGGLRSRIELNLDLPVRASELVSVIAHEAFPGHHLEHAWKEADLVDRAGRLEASAALINTPESLISEGLADVGRRFAVPDGSEPELLVELFERAGLPVVADPARATDVAQRTVAIAEARRRLAGVRVNAALMRHAEGAGHEETRAYLERVGLYPPNQAAKRLEFIEHPLWRTYVFVYSEGERLLARWLELAAPRDRPARFGRLLHEQLTPGAILHEIAAGAA